MVGYGTFRENEFIRLVTINAGNSKEDMLHFFIVLENFVAKNKALFVTETEKVVSSKMLKKI